MTTTLTVALVVLANGIDLDASRQAFSDALDSYIAERAIEDDNIGSAVHAVFDQYPSANINMPALTSYVLQKLNASPENFNALEARVMEYVRVNADAAQKSKDGVVTQFAEEPGTRTFVIAKGKGGGVKRWRKDESGKLLPGQVKA